MCMYTRVSALPDKMYSECVSMHNRALGATHYRERKCVCVCVCVCVCQTYEDGANPHVSLPHSIAACRNSPFQCFSLSTVTCGVRVSCVLVTVSVPAEYVVRC